MTDFHFVISLLAFVASVAGVTGYCFGRAHEIEVGDKAAERWYNAYQEVLKRLHQP